MAVKRDSDWLFFRRLLIAVAVVAGVYLIWRISGILLLLFAAILVATLLVGASDAISRRTFLGRRTALGATILGLILALGGFVVLFGSQLAEQLSIVVERAPEALDAAGQWLGISDASGRLARSLDGNGAEYFTQAATMGYTVLQVVGELLLVLVTAVYLAANPGVYRDGAARLFPQEVQSKVTETASVLAAALRLWFLGQLVSMVFVGTLAATAFWIIGLPIPLGLGAIAGLTNFIPLVGPILGTIPAVLFAFTIDISTVAWTAAAVLVIQQIEGYVVTPLVQRQVVSMPPAVLLFAIVILGLLFGWLGIILAAPITVAAMVIVQKIWVRDVIGEKVKVPGEASARR